MRAPIPEQEAGRGTHRQRKPPAGPELGIRGQVSRCPWTGGRLETELAAPGDAPAPRVQDTHLSGARAPGPGREGGPRGRQRFEPSRPLPKAQHTWKAAVTTRCHLQSSARGVALGTFSALGTISLTRHSTRNMVATHFGASGEKSAPSQILNPGINWNSKPNIDEWAQNNGETVTFQQLWCDRSSNQWGQRRLSSTP